MTSSTTDTARIVVQGAHDAVDSLTELADDAKLSQLVAIQRSVLQRFQDINGQLGSFDKDTLKQVDDACKEIARNCELLTIIKADLHSIFKRIRSLKRKLHDKLQQELDQQDASALPSNRVG